MKSYFLYLLIIFSTYHLTSICSDTETIQYNAAGILPYAFFKNEAHFLLGQVLIGHKNNEPILGWTDFGGKKAREDKTPLTTALREFNEETRNCYSTEINHKDKSIDFTLKNNSIKKKRTQNNLENQLILRHTSNHKQKAVEYLMHILKCPLFLQNIYQLFLQTV